MTLLAVLFMTIAVLSVVIFMLWCYYKILK